MTQPGNHYPPRTAGFRFSALDAGVLVVGALATAALWPLIDVGALVVPAALGHFFLFCNVFRLERRLELAWAALFVLNASLCVASGSFSWPKVLLVQTPVTLAVIGLEIASPRYHGILSRRLNRHLDEYLLGAQKQDPDASGA